MRIETERLVIRWPEPVDHGWALGLRRIVALIHPDNEASANVARRLHMRHERDVMTASGKLRRLFVWTPGERPQGTAKRLRPAASEWRA